MKIIYLIILCFFSLNTKSQTALIADRFDYPIGNKGLSGNDVPDIFLENIISYGGEKNELYPSNLSNTKARIGFVSSSLFSSNPNGSLWNNSQDVGSYYGAFGGYHPGEDWNLRKYDINKNVVYSASEIGELVYSIANGEVVKTGVVSNSGVESRLGKYVVIKHVLPDNTIVYSYYVHIGSLTVNENDPQKKFVVRGQAIASIADVTDVDDHLHFEIRKIAQLPLSLWEGGAKGYYSGSKVMQDYGIIDASDFIDENRIVGKPINSYLDIYAGPKATPKQKVKIWCYPSGANSNAFLVSGFKINGNPKTISVINPEFNSSNKKVSFDLDFRNIVSGADNGPYNFEFDITVNNQTTHFFSDKLYFLDNTDYKDPGINDIDYYGRKYLGIGTRNGLFKGSKISGSWMFYPGNFLTKGQATKLIANIQLKLDLIAGINASATNGIPPPVTNLNSEFFPYLMTLYNINSQYLPYNQNGEFNLNENITLEEFCWMLDKAFQLPTSTNIRSKVSKINWTDFTSSARLAAAQKIANIFASVNDDTGNELSVETLASFFYYVSSNTIATPYVKGNALIKRSAMAKVITNIFLWKAKQSGYTDVSARNFQGNSANTFFVIGDKFESDDLPTGTTPALSPQLLSSYTINDNQTLTLSHASDHDAANNGVPLYFYWTASGGDTLIATNSNYRTVQFVPGKVTVPTTFRLYTLAGNTLGKIREYFINVIVNPTNPASTTTVPSQQATNLQIVGTGENNLSINWTRGNGTSCIVTCTPAAFNIVPPQMNQVYIGNTNYSIAGTVLNETRVVYTGTGNSINITNLQPGTAYKIAIYEYNGTTNETVKYQTSPLLFTLANTKEPSVTRSDFSWNTTPLVNGVPATFFSNAQNATTFNWSVTPAATVVNPAAANTTITFPTSGTYLVKHTVSNVATGQNDTKTTSVSVLNAATNLPDLQIQAIETNFATVTAGNTLQVKCNVVQSNTNVSSVNQSFLVQYYLSTDQTIDINDFAVGQQSVTVGTGFSKSATHSFTVPVNFSSNYYILIRADNSNQITELNESNNTGSYPLQIVAALPDFTITNLTLAGGNTVKSGQAITANLTVLNKGQIAYQSQSLYDYNSMYNISYYLSVDNKLDDSDVGIIINGSVLSQPPVSPNQSISFANTLAQIPPDWPSGNFHLIVVFDPVALRDRDHNVELDETNNSFAVPVTIANGNQPTIQVSDIRITNISSSALTISWVNGNGNKRIVIGRHTGIPFAPVDGVAYTGNNNWLTAPLIQYPNVTASRVLYVGTNNSVTVTGLNPDSTYFFAVYELNDLGGSNVDYLQKTKIAAIQVHTPPVSPVVNGWKTLMKNSMPMIGGVQFLTKDSGFINTNLGVASTTDGGTTWRFNEYKGVYFYNGKYYDYASYGNGNTNNVYFPRQNESVGFLTDGAKIFVSKNMGIDWQQVYDNKKNVSYNRFFMLSPAVSFFTINQNGTSSLFKSVDTAKTYSEIFSINSQIENLWDIYFVDLNNGWVVSGNGVVYRTINGGSTWSVSRIPTGCTALGYANVYFTSISNGLYTDVCGNVYRTTDGAVSWQQVFSQAGQVFTDIEFLNPLNGRIHFGKNYITTTDGGLTWKPDSVPAFAPTYNMGVSSSVSENNLYVAGRNGSNTILLSTTTGGNTSKLEITTLLPSSICTGTIINLNYTLVGNFNAGNKIKAELSDSAGLFSFPRSLAEVTSITSGAIQVQIPANLPSSAKYKIKLVASDPTIVSDPTAFFSVTAAPIMSVSGLQASYPTNAGSVALQGLPAGGVFRVNGAISSVLDPGQLAAGNHLVTYTITQSGCSYVLERTVQVYVPLSVTISSSLQATYCSGSIVPVTFNTTGNFDSTNYFVVQLSDPTGSFTNAVDIGSINSQTGININSTIPVTMPNGTGYRLRIVGASGTVISNPTAPFTITAASIPSVVISPSVISVCQGKPVVFTSTATAIGSSPQYQWFVNGATDGTNASSFVSNSLFDGDVIQLRVTGNAACVTQSVVFSNLVKMDVVSKSDTPEIARFDSVLVSTVPFGNQWYRNGLKIDGATDQFYITQTTGIYQVRVNQAPCDTLVSLPLNYIVTSINEATSIEGRIDLYPNPAISNITLRGLEKPNKYQLLITDISGKVVFTKNVQQASSYNLDIMNLNFGSYIIYIYDITKKRHLQPKKFIKSN